MSDAEEAKLQAIKRSLAIGQKAVNAAIILNKNRKRKGKRACGASASLAGGKKRRSGKSKGGKRNAKRRSGKGKCKKC